MSQRLQNKLHADSAYAERIRSMQAENQLLRDVNTQWKAFLRTLVEYPWSLDESEVRRMAAEELTAVAPPAIAPATTETMGDRVRRAGWDGDDGLTDDDLSTTLCHRQEALDTGLR